MERRFYQEPRGVPDVKRKEKAYTELVQGKLQEGGRYAHTCYKEKLGHCASMNMLRTTVANDSKCENALESVVLANELKYMVEKRSEYIVFEDNFHSFLNNKYSLMDVKNACRFHVKEDDFRYHENQLLKYPERIQLFKDRGLPSDIAEACAFVLSYYTGNNSETVNRGASIVARKGNSIKVMEEVDDSLIIPILYFMVMALSVVPYFWGIVNRCVQLTDEELNDYQVGDVVSWTQFSSSNKGTKKVSFFKGRNTTFRIYSLTGRSINAWSNFPKEEDEILFLPMSCFLVIEHKMEKDPEDNIEKHVIHMRQVELGLSKRTILWVDDNILRPDWENKGHMEAASASQMNQNIHFIPKEDTPSAIAFLKSVFGKRLKQLNDDFRVITDMTRNNENPSHNAGARFVKQLRDLGFRCKVLIFTSDANRGTQYVIEQGVQYLKDVVITQTVADAQKFISFR